MSTRSKKTLAFLEDLAGGPNTIGKLLRAIREGEEMSQAQFAEKLGISRHNLSDIENERRGVSPKKAVEFAKKLRYSKQAFLQLALEDQLKRDGIKIKNVSVAL